jgi:uncharacterized alpha-E superfamily protein
MNRGDRHEYLNEVILGCHQISGLFANSMNKDAASEFIRLGRTLERADMATRILDAGAAVILATGRSSDSISQIVWGNVLRSLDAYQPYLRNERGPVTGPTVAAFLLANEQYPRTVLFSVNRMTTALSRLPHNNAPRKLATQIKDNLLKYQDYNDLGDKFRLYINDLQLQLGKLHDCFEDTWFSLESKTV